MVGSEKIVNKILTNFLVPTHWKRYIMLTRNTINIPSKKLEAKMKKEKEKKLKKEKKRRLFIFFKSKRKTCKLRR